MNRIEAQKALVNDGAKVRLAMWRKDEYLYLSECGIICENKGCAANVDLLFGDNSLIGKEWEIYDGYHIVERVCDKCSYHDEVYCCMRRGVVDRFGTCDYWEARK